MLEVKKKDIIISFGFNMCKIYDIMKYNQIATFILLLDSIFIFILEIIYIFRKILSRWFLLWIWSSDSLCSILLSSLYISPNLFSHLVTQIWNWGFATLSWKTSIYSTNFRHTSLNFLSCCQHLTDIWSFLHFWLVRILESSLKEIHKKT